MGQINSKLRSVAGGFAHWCPGCEGMHVIMTHRDPDFPGPAWSFDGNTDAPTFNPSVLITYNGSDVGQKRDGDDERAPAARCHYFLHAGVLQFCGDSTHSLAGQNVSLPDIPASHRTWND